MMVPKVKSREQETTVVAQNPTAFLVFPAPIIQGVMRNPLTLSGSIYNGVAWGILVTTCDRSFKALAMFLLFLAKSSELRGELARKPTENGDELREGFVARGEGCLGNRVARK